MLTRGILVAMAEQPVQKLDLRGRIKNFVLPATSALVPVFEAVMNGLHAAREAPQKSGVVRVHALATTATNARPSRQRKGLTKLAAAARTSRRA